MTYLIIGLVIWGLLAAVFGLALCAAAARPLPRPDGFEREWQIESESPRVAEEVVALESR